MRYLYLQYSCRTTFVLWIKLYSFYLKYFAQYILLLLWGIYNYISSRLSFIERRRKSVINWWNSCKELHIKIKKYDFYLNGQSSEFLHKSVQIVHSRFHGCRLFPNFHRLFANLLQSVFSNCFNIQIQLVLRDLARFPIGQLFSTSKWGISTQRKEKQL